MEKLQRTIKVLEEVAQWFEATPVYPYASTTEEEKSRDNALAKAEIAWRLCYEGRQIGKRIEELLSEIKRDTERKK